MAVIVALFLFLVISAEENSGTEDPAREVPEFKPFELPVFQVLPFAISAAQTLIFVLIGNYMLGIEGMVFRYWIVLFTASCWANMIGLRFPPASSP